jgi:hypothetical protein
VRLVVNDVANYEVNDEVNVVEFKKERLEAFCLVRFKCSRGCWASRCRR